MIEYIDFFVPIFRTQAEDEAYRNASSWNDYQKLLSGKLCDIRTEFGKKLQFLLSTIEVK